MTTLPAFLIAYSDASFTNPHEVVLPDDPKDCRGDFTHMGAKYWGIESKRHKATTLLVDEQSFAYDHDAHNWFVIGLKQRAEIEKITISTKFYTGNQVRAVSAYLTDELTGKKKQVLNREILKPDAEHTFDIPPTTATECLIECYYEGGISRVNFFGKTAKEQLPQRKNLLDGAAISHISNEHYGKPDQAVQGHRREMHMIGWESARTGFGEQALFHLKKPALLKEIIIDTYLHRLNAPLSAHIFAVNAKADDIDALIKKAPRWKIVFDEGREIIPDHFQSYMLEQKYLNETGIKNKTEFRIKLHLEDTVWKPVLPFAPLQPDTYHRLPVPEMHGAVTHVLYMYYPNGGIHGLKVHGDEI